MPGPPPQPAELRVLKGNGKDRDVAGRKVRRQPKTVNVRPPKPDFGDDRIASEQWDYYAPLIERMGVFGPTDRATLEAYCRSYSIWKKHDGGRGYSVVTMTMVNIGSKLGLDPASRLRMTLPETEDDDEAAVFG